MEHPLAAELLVEEAPTTRRQLRVAVVTETYPPEVNGVALTVARMVSGLQAHHHAIGLVRPRQGDVDRPAVGATFDEVLCRGLPIPRYPNLRMGLPATRALARLWTLRRPDVVHIATEGPLGWSALRAAERLKLPVVSDFRTNFHAYSRHYGIGWLNKPIVGYLRQFHNRTMCTMVPTEPLRRELEALGFENLKVVSRGVDTTGLRPSYRDEALRRQWRAGPDTLVVLCVSRLAPEKNLELAAAAYHRIRVGGRDARLVLVGDGPAKAALERRCSGAVFAGMRHGADLAAHYASADLFVFPSMTETFGNVVPEAMASGLPVLAFDCAAAGQLIRHADNGLLARESDSAHFLGLAVEASRNLAALRAMGLRARASALALDWSRVVDDLESVLVQATLQSLIARRSLALRPLGA